MVSLLQPPPETFDLFHDLVLIADGAPGQSLHFFGTHVNMIRLRSATSVQAHSSQKCSG